MLYAQMNLPTWLPRPGMLTARHAVTTLRKAVMKVARERRGAELGDDLLARLIAARDPETGRAMDDAQIVDNLLTFYLAGHETTAKALTWTLYLLARSPGWSARLREEIAAVTGGGPVQAQHLDRLVLVQQVVKESMRLYPPVPIMSRQAVADTMLGEHPVTAGTSVLMPIYAIHRHAARWDRPAEFDPERFAPSREIAMPRYQYMPFGAGPRICIGMPFAMMESTAILATLLAGARFEWAGREEPMPIARVTLMPKGGMPMTIGAMA
jgi:cytochrome P450